MGLSVQEGQVHVCMKPAISSMSQACVGALKIWRFFIKVTAWTLASAGNWFEGRCSRHGDGPLSSLRGQGRKASQQEVLLR